MRSDTIKMDCTGRGSFQDAAGQQQRFLRSQSVAFGSLPIDPHFQSMLEAQRRHPSLSPGHGALEAAHLHSGTGIPSGFHSGSSGFSGSDIESVSMAEMARETSYLPPEPIRFAGRTRRDSLPDASRRPK
jgi:hypothetical protein